MHKNMFARTFVDENEKKIEVYIRYHTGIVKKEHLINCK